MVILILISPLCSSTRFSSTALMTFPSPGQCLPVGGGGSGLKYKNRTFLRSRMTETMFNHDLIEPESEDFESERIDREPTLLCPSDYDDNDPQSKLIGREPALLCSADYDDGRPESNRIDGEPALLCSADYDDQSVNSTSGKTPPSYFVFSRLPTSPLDWRLTLVYSYLCSRTRFNRGAGLRDIQAATGMQSDDPDNAQERCRRRATWTDAEADRRRIGQVDRQAVFCP